ncbi:MAG: flavin reductase family protein [Candidatus Hydrogenedentota bacterium]|nr:MAG: flavin reductase family protein [Candidatus Hydrogenedentota bacterium]
MKKKIDPESLSRKDAYFFGISLICPRPIAFVTSLNKDGLVNAAPFSYFNGISTRPFLIGISIADKGKGIKKDTLNNIIEKKEFCVNLINSSMAEGVTISATDFPSDVSEMDFNGFHLEPAETISVPRIQESPAVMECVLERIIDDLGPFSYVIGRARSIYAEESFIDSQTGYFLPKEADLLGRLGGSDFCKIGDIITVKRKPVEEFLQKKK